MQYVILARDDRDSLWKSGGVYNRREVVIQQASKRAHNKGIANVRVIVGKELILKYAHNHDSDDIMLINRYCDDSTYSCKGA